MPSHTQDNDIDPARKQPGGDEDGDPGIEHDLDHQRPVGCIHIGLAKRRCRDEQICEPLRRGRSEVRRSPDQDRQKRQRHAEDEGGIDAAEARDGEADRRPSLRGIGNHETADHEEGRYAEKAVFRNRRQPGNGRYPVSARPPEAEMVQNHAQHRDQAQ